jgi:hypothetical protein
MNSGSCRGTRTRWPEVARTLREALALWHDPQPASATVSTLNEWLHAQLMSSLSRVGRRGEALEAYQSARRILIDELGLEPSRELQQIHREMLAAS